MSWQMAGNTGSLRDMAVKYKNARTRAIGIVTICIVRFNKKRPSHNCFFVV